MYPGCYRELDQFCNGPHLQLMHQSLAVNLNRLYPYSKCLSNGFVAMTVEQ